MIQLPATIEKIETLADNSIRIKVSTQELNPKDAAELFSLKGKLGWFLFKADKLTLEDIPKEPPPEFRGDKTPSKRLRAVIYKFWEQATSQTEDFETFYRKQIELIIESFKEKLE